MNKNIFNSTNKIKIFLIIMVSVVVFYFFIFPRIFNPYKVVQLPQTIGIRTDSDFQFTLSPNNNWIVYFEVVDDYKEIYNFVAIDTLKQKKYVIEDLGLKIFRQPELFIKNACWSMDSRYCVMQDINGGPDVIIDFNSGEPVVKREDFNNLDSKGFTCSDCGNLFDKYKTFGNNKHGAEYVSPNGNFIAQTISRGQGFVTPPNLYITEKGNKRKVLVDQNVYYDVHFTSDSSRLYYTSCENDCARTNYLNYVDLKK